MTHAHGEHGGHDPGEEEDGQGCADPMTRNRLPEIPVALARPADTGHHGRHHGLAAELAHWDESWIAQSPTLLEKFKQRVRDRFEMRERWTFDPDRWKPTTGLDELVFFWNELPRDAEVELFLPGTSVEEVFNFRSLRHAPQTVKIVDPHTLRLFPTGTTFLPIARVWGDNLAGMLRVTLPAGIEKGQRFRIDVVQMRADEARTLGGFQLQLQIQVEKAEQMWEAERRTLELFQRRLSIRKETDRW